MKPTDTIEQLIATIENGKFTRDGSNIICKDLSIDRKNMTSLKGCPQYVSDVFSCTHNELTTLEGGPVNRVTKYFAWGNKLVSLEGIPEHLDFLNVRTNRLTEFKDFTSHIQSLNISDNPFKTFHNIHKCILSCQQILLRDLPTAPTHLLGLLLIPQLKILVFSYSEPLSIIYNYLKTNKAVYKCAQELVIAGFPELAKL